jgi:AAA+ superfamily predicted ATPase
MSKMIRVSDLFVLLVLVLASLSHSYKHITVISFAPVKSSKIRNTIRTQTSNRIESTRLYAVNFPSTSNYNRTLTQQIIGNYNKKGSDPVVDSTTKLSGSNATEIPSAQKQQPPPRNNIFVTFATKMLKFDKTPVTRSILTNILRARALCLWALSPQNRKQMSLGALSVAALISIQRYLKFVASLTTELSFSGFMQLLKDSPERVQALKVTSTSFMFLLDGKSRILTRVVPVEANLLDKLITSGIDFATPSSPKNVLGLFWTLGYCFFLWKMSSRMMQGPKDEGAGSRKDKAYSDISFEDVAGQDNAKLEVKELCDMLKSPEKFAQIGARLPSGVLLVGPPGSGKTLLARVSAAEAKVPFYACSASDFVEVFVGRGPARVRKLFKQAAENSPCIVFIDEIDSIGRSRRMGSMNSEQENTLNQLLTCMDGLDTSNNGVIVMGATNRVELLDPALLRAGRFDRIVQCPLPDKIGRLEILRVHTRKLKMGANVDLERIAKGSAGTCGADLAAIANEAAIRTLRRNGTTVDMQDLEDALKNYYSSRGVPLSGLAESLIPDWIKNGGLSPSLNG